MLDEQGLKALFALYFQALATVITLNNPPLVLDTYLLSELDLPYDCL